MERESNFKRTRDIHGQMIREWMERQNELLSQWTENEISYTEYRIKNKCAIHELEVIGEMFQRILHSIND